MVQWTIWFARISLSASTSLDAMPSRRLRSGTRSWPDRTHLRALCLTLWPRHRKDPKTLVVVLLVEPMNKQHRRSNEGGGDTGEQILNEHHAVEDKHVLAGSDT